MNALITVLENLNKQKTYDSNAVYVFFSISLLLKVDADILGWIP